MKKKVVGKIKTQILCSVFPKIVPFTS